MAATFSGWNKDLTNHINNKANPHGVNYEQVKASPSGFMQNKNYYNSGSFIDCINDLKQKGFLRVEYDDPTSLTTFYVTNEVTGLPDSNFGWYSCLIIGVGNERTVIACPSWTKNKLYWCGIYIPTDDDKYVMDENGWQEFDGKSNTNLLRNSRFNINQRGKTTYSECGYCIDGWIIQDPGVTVTYEYGTVRYIIFNDSLKLLGQHIESIYNYRGQVVTLTLYATSITGNCYMTDGGNLAAEGQHQNIKIKEGYTTWTFKINENVDPNMATISFWGDKNTSFHPIAIKMELGRVSSLPIDIMQAYTEKDYEEDLIYCQRYLQVYNDVSLMFNAITNWYGYCPFDLMKQFRVNPTFSYEGEIAITDDTPNDENVIISDIELYSGNVRKPILKALTTDGKMIAGKNYRLKGLDLIFSAEV